MSRRTIAETDAEERRIAERLERNPRRHPLGQIREEANSTLKHRGTVSERRGRRNRAVPVTEQSLNKPAVPPRIGVAAPRFGHERIRVVTKSDFERAEQQAEKDCASP